MMFISIIYNIIGQIFIFRQPALLQSATTAGLPSQLAPLPTRRPAWWLLWATLPSMNELGLLLAVTGLLGLALPFARRGHLWLQGDTPVLLVYWRYAPLLRYFAGTFASLYAAWAFANLRRDEAAALLAGAQRNTDRSNTLLLPRPLALQLADTKPLT